MQSDTKSFILRIWVESEADENNPSTWRGVVEQVGSTKRLYFQDLGNAFKFVQEQTGIRIRTDSNRSWLRSTMEWISNASHIHRHQ